MKNNYYCRAWYKGKKRKALEQAVSLLKQFDWCDCNELSQDKLNTATELTKMIYDNVSRTAYKVNGESYMKNRLHKRSLTHNSEIVLIAFGDCDDLSKVPMMITE